MIVTKVGNDIVRFYSSNGGVTWISPATLMSGNAMRGPWVVRSARTDKAYAVFAKKTAGEHYDIYASFSEHFGNDWSTAVRIVQDATYFSDGVVCAVDNSTDSLAGRVYVIWIDEDMNGHYGPKVAYFNVQGGSGDSIYVPPQSYPYAALDTLGDRYVDSVYLWPPTVTVDGAGTVYVAHYFGSSGVSGFKISLSKDGGDSWSQVDSNATLNGYPPNNDSANVLFRHAFSLTASHSDSTVFLAQESAGMINAETTMNIADTDASFTWFDNVTTNDSNWVSRAPAMAAYDTKHQFVAFYGRATILGLPHDTITGVYLGFSADSGQSWKTVRVDTCYMLLSSFVDIVGPSIGLTVFDSLTAGIAYKKENDSLYFARVNLDTVRFRAEFNGSYAFGVYYAPKRDTSHWDSVPSQQSRELCRGVDYYGKPDAKRHNNYSSSNFTFFKWNKSGASPDLNFVHSFTPNGSFNQVQEVNYTYIDSLVDSVNLEGAPTRDSLQWKFGTAGGFVMKNSPLAIDTAYRNTFSNNVTYSFQAKNKVINWLSPSVPWDTSWFEAWSLNDVSSHVDTLAWSNFKIVGKTHLSPLYKTHLKSASAAALDQNGGRKVAWNRDSSIFHIIYESRGNVYFASSADSQFCEFRKEMRLNKNYTFGQAFNPTVAYFTPHPNPFQMAIDTDHVVLAAWEEVTGSIHRIKLRTRKSDTWNNDTTVSAWNFTGNYPGAPSICAAEDSGMAYNNVRGALVWNQGDSLWFAAIDNNLHVTSCGWLATGAAFSRGEFATIEPGRQRGDTADFIIAFQKHGSADNGADGGVFYQPALVSSNGRHAQSMEQVRRNVRYPDSSTVSTVTHPSIVITRDSTVIVAMDESRTQTWWYSGHSAMQLVNMFTHDTVTIPAVPGGRERHSFFGINVRAKKQSATNWGSGLILLRPGLADTSAWAPSLSIFDSMPDYFYVTFYGKAFSTHQDSLYKFQPQFRHTGFAYPRVSDVFEATCGDGSTRLTAAAGYSARTPQQPYSQEASMAQKVVLSSSRPVTGDYPRTLKRASRFSCGEPDNMISRNPKDYDELTALCSSAATSFVVGEFTIMDSAGTPHALAMNPPVLDAPCATMADIHALNGTVYFHPTDDSMNVIFYRIAGSTDSVGVVSTFSGDTSVRYTIELVDSVTDSTIQSLDLHAFAAGSVSTMSGYDTICVRGMRSLGKTLFIRTRIDTTGAWTGGELGYNRILLDGKLSAIMDSGAGMGKQVVDRGRAGTVPVFPNEIDLVVGPNPFSTSTHIFYTVPIEDADQITEILVFGMNGQDVSSLVHDVKTAGRHEVDFDGTRLPTGNYVLAVHLKYHMQSKLIGVVR